MKIMSNIISRRNPKNRKWMKFLALVFALTMAVFTLPITTLAGDIFHFSGLSADAGFFNSNPQGCFCYMDPTCICTNVFVFATESRFQNPPGPGGRSSSAFVAIYQYDSTIPLLYIDCSVPLADSDFQVNKMLDSATFTATLLGCFGHDYVYDSDFYQDVNVDLVWTGIGPLSRGNSHNHFQSPGYIVNEHFNGTSRPADVSGSVSDGSTDFTPNSGFGSIISVKSGTVVID